MIVLATRTYWIYGVGFFGFSLFSFVVIGYGWMLFNDSTRVLYRQVNIIISSGIPLVLMFYSPVNWHQSTYHVTLLG